MAADFRKTMVRLTDRQVSEGHGERFDAIVWANEAATGAWETGSAMPDGAVLVEEGEPRLLRLLEDCPHEVLGAGHS